MKTIIIGTNYGTTHTEFNSLKQSKESGYNTRGERIYCNKGSKVEFCHNGTNVSLIIERKTLVIDNTGGLIDIYYN